MYCMYVCMYIVWTRSQAVWKSFATFSEIENFFCTGYIRKVETLLLVLNVEKVHVMLSIMDVIFTQR